MKEVSRLLSMKQLVTTPYHPMCNGLVERFNGTMKQMLKRMCAERPKDWDRYLPALLFAYREVPQESLGFSPFELLYRRLRIQVVYVDFCGIFFILPSYYVSYCRCFGILLA